MPRPLCILLIAFAALIQSGWGSWQYSGTSGDFTYTATYDQVAGGAYKGTATITGYTGSAANVVIPESVSFTATQNGQSVTVSCAVTAIQSNVFNSRAFITGVTIPETVKSIGHSVFYSCSGLTSVTLPEGLNSIGEAVFANCTGLMHVYIPSSMVTMGGTQLSNAISGAVFEGCSGLIDVTIGCGANIGHGAFQGCANLTTVTFVGEGAGVNPWNIGNSAFRNCTNLVNMSLPGGLINIGSMAFRGCSKLSNAVIPLGVTTIGEYAFQDCQSLAYAAIPASVLSWGSGRTFLNCTNLIQVELADGLTSLGALAFRDCTGLKSIKIPSSLTVGGGSAFYGCTSLEDVVLEPGLAGLPDEMFGGCSRLSKITIPESVASIGGVVFRNCTLLKSAFFQGNAPAIDIDASLFWGCPVTCYYLHGASGFTSPTWQGYPCFIAAPYGGVIPNSTINQAHLIGGASAEGNVKLEAPVTQAPLLWQRQTTPVILDMETSRTLLLGATGTVRVEAGDGALTIGKNPGDGFLTAGGNTNTPGTLVLDNASANDITVNAMIANNGSAAVGVTKTSSGRAILSATNSYSGNTSVTGGTLVLKSPCLADASAVTIATGSALNLDYAGADIVSSLILNGTRQPDGLYDSTNSGGLITGTGKIQVGPFANFSTWAAAIAPGQTADQDHDHDGVPNGVEYFMGASASGFTINPALINGTVTWPKSPAFNGSYQIQTSTDLSIWTDVTNDSAQVTPTANSVIWTRPAIPGNRFVRLVVQPN